MSTYKRGDKIVDRDGYHGVVENITNYDGSIWYDVRIMDGSRNVGVVVRYEADLSHR